jgi:hypothetical protein
MRAVILSAIAVPLLSACQVSVVHKEPVEPMRGVSPDLAYITPPGARRKRLVDGPPRQVPGDAGRHQGLGAMNAVYVTFFPMHKPARSAFGTGGLALGGRVEIECMAVI